ncbi:MAG: transcriptional regulator [Candidatus Cloacimonadota bacterium]|nr:MAG: transcriptional regulator [Candidatus Cloacimonadota bacterium]
MKKNNCRSNCPLSITLDIIGDKWSLLIIRDMIFMKKKYYGDFLNSSEKIATNILSNRLKSLESHSFITKTKDSNNRSKFIYQLSKKGVDLFPILLEMILWGDKYNDNSSLPSEFIQKIKKDKDKMVHELLNSIN